MTERLAAVLFDVDGTLIDSATATNRAWRRWAERHGLDTTIVARREGGRRTVDNIRVLAPALDAIAEARRLEHEQAQDTAGIAAYDGATELIRQLQARGIAWAIGTSASSAVVHARMRAVGLPLPPVIVTGDDIEHGKPAPDVYLLAAERLGVAPSSAVVVEDAPAGVEAGHAAGAAVIAVASTHPCSELRDADRCVARLGDVWDCLQANGGAGARADEGQRTP